MTLEDSTTYQQILSKGVSQGRVEATIRMLIRIGTAKFGAAPSPAQLARLNGIGNLERLEELADQLPHTVGWYELLEAD